MIIEEIIQYEPFRTLWKRNKRAEGKGMAIMDCEFVYYMYANKADNPYRSVPEKQRMEELKENIYKGKYREDATIIWALEKWRKINDTTEQRLLNTSMIAAERIIEYLSNIDWKSRALDVDNILKDLESISKAKGVLDQLKKIRAAAESNTEASMGRGKQEIGEFEDEAIAKEYDAIK